MSGQPERIQYEFVSCVCMLRIIALSVDCEQFGIQYSKSNQVVEFYLDS